jgi:hypothetical protein
MITESKDSELNGNESAVAQTALTPSTR